MPGPIPWSVLDRYAERHGIEDFEEFEALIRAMDNAWIDHHRSRLTTSKQPGPDGGRK